MSSVPIRLDFFFFFRTASRFDSLVGIRGVNQIEDAATDDARWWRLLTVPGISLTRAPRGPAWPHIGAW